MTNCYSDISNFIEEENVQYDVVLVGATENLQMEAVLRLISKNRENMNPLIT